MCSSYLYYCLESEHVLIDNHALTCLYLYCHLCTYKPLMEPFYKREMQGQDIKSRKSLFASIEQNILLENLCK